MRLALKDLPPTERPQYRAEQMGVNTLSNAELMQLVVGCGYTDITPSLLATGESLMGVARMTQQEMAEIDGLGKTGAMRLKAAFELGRRLTLETNDKPQVRSPADAANLLLGEMQLLDQEHLVVLALNSRNRVIAQTTVYKGNLNTNIIRVAEVFRDAIKRNAAAIIISHNHPSGDPIPSPEDVKVTEIIVKAGAMLDIEVLDHLIIGQGRWVSLKERGLGF